MIQAFQLRSAFGRITHEQRRWWLTRGMELSIREMSSKWTVAMNKLDAYLYSDRWHSLADRHSKSTLNEMDIHGPQPSRRLTVWHFLLAILPDEDNYGRVVFLLDENTCEYLHSHQFEHNKTFYWELNNSYDVHRKSARRMSTISPYPSVT